MSKPKHNIKEFHWLALKEAVQTAFGKSINDAKDIDQLHLQLFERTGNSLSTSTLYRLLLSPANKNIPY